MLGWMLKRGVGVEDAPPAPNFEGDTTQLDQPDTPAPVFAARAFKSALFGTPAARSAPQSQKPQPNKDMDDGSRTPPSKPQGILLTPGTGTSRPKRVSFGREVKGARSKSSLSTRVGAGSGIPSQQAGDGVTESDGHDPGADTDDDEWEEDHDDQENFCNHDITVDLNEPQSQSGKFWKDQFDKYRDDAQVELDKMLKYKQLAKSYAQLKDAEAIDLAEKLKEEQQKVIKMERRIAENASQIMAQNDNETAADASPDMIRKLTKQTALAIQHKQRVQELETQLEELMEGRNNEMESPARRRLPTTSPRAQKTLLETQRELRKARTQVKELNSLREQVSELKEKLRAAEKRAAKVEQAPASETMESSRAKDLRAQLRAAQEESKTKDVEIRQLKKDFDVFREEKMSHERDSKAVLERAHSKIAELKKEVKSLKAANHEHATRPINWHPQTGLRDHEPTATAELDVDAPVRVYTRRTKRDEKRATEATMERRTEDADGNLRSLRDKFQLEGPSASSEAVRTTTMSGALVDRPVLEKPRWQPFVPRSPRNRDYLGESLAHKIQNGGVTPRAAKSDDLDTQDLTSLAKSIAQSDGHISRRKAEPKIDLLTDRFAKLGGPGASAQPSAPTARLSERAVKSRLPPERHAAAMARIEQRRAEKKLQRQQGLDKENVQPFLS